MRTVHYKSWKRFREFVLGYVAQDRERREQLAFRGHASSEWNLKTTLDRHRSFVTDQERNDYYKLLSLQFRREAMRLSLGVDELPPSGDAFDLKARHHGLPSPILDWTESPYVAAFFAFEGTLAPDAPSVAIWSLDRTRYDSRESRTEWIDDPDLIRFNRRALQQRGLFLRVGSIETPLADSLEHALTKIVVPSESRREALDDLDAMMINATNLYSDLDGAVKAAKYRMNH